MRYEDFVLQIGPDLGEGYSVNVVKSPAGEGTGTFRSPFHGEELGEVLMGLGRTATRSTKDRHMIPGGAGGDVTASPLDVGASLFRSLFTGKVRSLYDQSLGSTEAVPDRGLRIQIKLNPEHPDLARLYSLPWELLYRPDTQDFLSLSRMTPVVRYLDVSRQSASYPLPSPLRILAVIASPADLPRLDLRKERHNIEAAWGRHKGVEVVFLNEATPGAIREELLESPFHVLHFMGHGGFDRRTGEGVLFFDGPGGVSLPVSGPVLASKLKDFKSMRLVFLNACETARAAGEAGVNPFAGVASALVLGGIPAVLAMQFPISDQAAIDFSRAFYQRLAAGDPVDSAVAEGRQAVHSASSDSFEWATPVLFLRTPDGALFSRAATPETRPSAPSPGGMLGALSRTPGGRPGLRLAAAPAPGRRTSGWVKGMAASVGVGILVAGVALGAKIGFGRPGAEKDQQQILAGAQSTQTTAPPVSGSGTANEQPAQTTTVAPATFRREVEATSAILEIDQEARSNIQGFTVNVDRVELRGDRMRWYLQFFNRSEENERLFLDYSGTYLADESGTRYAPIEGQEVFEITGRYDWLVQRGVRLDRWIDFPAPIAGTKTFTVGLEDGTGYGGIPVFSTFTVTLPL